MFLEGECARPPALCGIVVGVFVPKAPLGKTGLGSNVDDGMLFRRVANNLPQSMEEIRRGLMVDAHQLTGRPRCRPRDKEFQQSLFLVT